MQCGNEKFAKTVGTKKAIVKISGNSREISNTNELLGVAEGVNGVKTGFTNNAGRCLVTSINRNGWEIIVVVLRADTKRYRASDSVKIIEYIYKNYQQVDIESIVKDRFNDWCEMNVGRIVINKANTSYITLQISELKKKIIPVKKTQIDNIDIDVNSLFYFDAPVVAKSKFGVVKVLVNGEVVEVLDMFNTRFVNRKSIGNYFIEFLQVIQSW